MTETRNILLLGRTGSGKSALANVLTNTNEFTESSGSTSTTKGVQTETTEIKLTQDGSEKVNYRIIDTIGIGDTKLTEQGYFEKLSEVVDEIKDGLNKILFVVRGKMTKEETEAYGLLITCIFDEEAINYTTIIRTGFPEFFDDDACKKDKEEVMNERPDIAEIMKSFKFIHVDNQPLKGLPKSIEGAKEARELSRKKLLNYLSTCRTIYKPSNLEILGEKIKNCATNQERIKILRGNMEEKLTDVIEKVKQS